MKVKAPASQPATQPAESSEAPASQRARPLTAKETAKIKAREEAEAQARKLVGSLFRREPEAKPPEARGPSVAHAAKQFAPAPPAKPVVPQAFEALHWNIVRDLREASLKPEKKAGGGEPPHLPHVMLGGRPYEPLLVLPSRKEALAAARELTARFDRSGNPVGDCAVVQDGKKFYVLAHSQAQDLLMHIRTRYGETRDGDILTKSDGDIDFQGMLRVIAGKGSRLVFVDGKEVK